MYEEEDGEDVVPRSVSSRYVHPRFLDIAREIALSPSFLKSRLSDKRFREAMLAAGVLLKDIEPVESAEEFSKGHLERSMRDRLTREEIQDRFENYQTERLYRLGLCVEKETLIKSYDEEKKIHENIAILDDKNDNAVSLYHGAAWNSEENKSVELLHRAMKHRDRSFWHRRGQRHVFTERTTPDTIVAKTHSENKFERTAESRFERRNDNALEIEKTRRNHTIKETIVRNMRQRNANHVSRVKKNSYIITQRRLANRFRNRGHCCGAFERPTFAPDTTRRQVLKGGKTRTKKRQPRRQGLTRSAESTSPRRTKRYVKPISMVELKAKRDLRLHREATAKEIRDASLRDATEMERHMREMHAELKRRGRRGE